MNGGEMMLRTLAVFERNEGDREAVLELTGDHYDHCYIYMKGKVRIYILACTAVDAHAVVEAISSHNIACFLVDPDDAPQAYVPNKPTMTRKDERPVPATQAKPTKRPAVFDMLQSMRDGLLDIDSEIEAIFADRDSLQARLAEAAEDIEDLRAKLAQSKAEADRLRNDYAGAVAEGKEMRKQRDRLQSELGAAKAIARAEADTNDMRNEIEMLRSETVRLAGELASATDHKSLKRQRDEAVKSREDWKRGSFALNKRALDAEEEARILRAQLDQIKAAISGAMNA